MARQEINIGASANDGTGDTLRNSFDKVNDNSLELYQVSGWGQYVDDLTTATQTINTTYSKLSINGAGGTSSSDYLPLEIRGSSELWDTVNNKILPINVGDSYDLRLDFTVTGKTGSPTLIDVVLDIGGGASPTIDVVSRVVNTSKSPPFNVSIGFPIFSLNTFVTNGGQIFLRTDTGTVTVSKRSIFIKRDFSGNL